MSRFLTLLGAMKVSNLITVPAGNSSMNGLVLGKMCSNDSKYSLSKDIVSHVVMRSSIVHELGVVCVLYYLTVVDYCV